MACNAHLKDKRHLLTRSLPQSTLVGLIIHA